MSDTVVNVRNLINMIFKINNIFPYNIEHKNNGDDWNGSSEYDYCHPGTDPDFGSYHSLMSISYSDCDVNTLAYKTCKHAERIYNNSVTQIVLLISPVHV